MTGAERKFALAYVPHEDVIRYNKGSKVLGINKGDYGRVLQYQSLVTISSPCSSRMDARSLTTLKDSQVFPFTSKPTGNLLSAIASNFVRPFADVKVKNTELGTITDIAQGEFTVSLGRRSCRYFQSRTISTSRPWLCGNQLFISGQDNGSSLGQC